jgi:hypothetical protein
MFVDFFQRPLREEADRIEYAIFKLVKASALAPRHLRTRATSLIFPGRKNLVSLKFFRFCKVIGMLVKVNVKKYITFSK